MKIEKLNAVGLACPMPVIKTKKLLEEVDVVETTVDNEIATQNLEKLATQLGYDFSLVKEDKNYVVTIAKENANVINTFSDSCVIPVTQAKRALEKDSKVTILVRTEKNVEDLENFAKKNNHKIEVSPLEEEGYKVTIVREEQLVEMEKESVKDDSYIVVVNKKIMGHGSEELGKRLIKSYFYALTEQEVLPKKILFYNDGATLVDKKTTHIADELKELEEAGVEILCCGACIDYHNIELVAGNATNMYFMVEDMRTANRIIRP